MLPINLQLYKGTIFYPEDITKVTFRALAASHSKWPTVERPASLSLYGENWTLISTCLMPNVIPLGRIENVNEEIKVSCGFRTMSVFFFPFGVENGDDFDTTIV